MHKNFLKNVWKLFVTQNRFRYFKGRIIIAMILNISYLTGNKVDAYAFNKRIKVMVNRMGRQLSNYHRLKCFFHDSCDIECNIRIKDSLYTERKNGVILNSKVESLAKLKFDP